MPEVRVPYRDDELEANLRVCPQCGHHYAVRVRDRIARLADAARSWRPTPTSAPPIRSEFFDLKAYKDRLAQAEMDTGLGDALVAGAASIERRPTNSPSWTSPSIGRVDGERRRREVRACERRGRAPRPARRRTASGGARMREGSCRSCSFRRPLPPSTSCARHARLITVMTHPTTAGVLASFASLGDVIVAELGALLASPVPRRPADDAGEARRLRPRRVEQPLRPRRRDRPPAELRPYLGRVLALFAIEPR